MRLSELRLGREDGDEWECLRLWLINFSQWIAAFAFDPKGAISARATFPYFRRERCIESPVPSTLETVRTVFIILDISMQRNVIPRRANRCLRLRECTRREWNRYLIDEGAEDASACNM